MTALSPLRDNSINRGIVSRPHSWFPLLEAALHVANRGTITIVSDIRGQTQQAQAQAAEDLMGLANCSYMTLNKDIADSLVVLYNVTLKDKENMITNKKQLKVMADVIHNIICPHILRTGFTCMDEDTWPISPNIAKSLKWLVKTLASYPECRFLSKSQTWKFTLWKLKNIKAALSYYKRLEESIQRENSHY